MIRPLLLIAAAMLVAVPVKAQFFANNNQQDWVAMWAFNGQTETQIKKQFESGYKMRVSMIDRLCTLDKVQKFKLEKAARTDITRFFHEVSKIRAKVDEMGDVNQNDNDDINKLWQIISPLATKTQQGLFNDGSLFRKVMRSTLDAEQHEAYEAELEKNRIRRWKTLTRANVAEIENSMPMVGGQREKLLELLDAETIKIKQMNRYMDGYIGYLKLLKLRKKDKELGGIFDEHQLAVINEYCDRYRGWEGMVE